HHKMFSIEEIRRISRIELERFEPGEWNKWRGRPFPAIANKAGDAESTGARRVCIDRSRRPAVEVKVPVMRSGRVVSPRISTFGSTRRPKCRAVKLRFGRK